MKPTADEIREGVRKFLFNGQKRLIERPTAPGPDAPTGQQRGSHFDFVQRCVSYRGELIGSYNTARGAHTYVGQPAALVCKDNWWIVDADLGRAILDYMMAEHEWAQAILAENGIGPIFEPKPPKPEIPKMDTAKLINDARKGAKLSQKQLGALTGTSQGRISEYEHGRRVPELRTLQAVAQACGLVLVVEMRPAEDIAVDALTGISMAGSTVVEGMPDGVIALVGEDDGAIMIGVHTCGPEWITVESADGLGFMCAECRKPWEEAYPPPGMANYWPDDSPTEGDLQSPAASTIRDEIAQLRGEE